MSSPLGASLSLSAPGAVLPPPTERDVEQCHVRWFAEEIQVHERTLRTYLRATYPTLRDVDDLVQEVYARILRARRMGEITSPKALLFTAARNVACDIFRHERVLTIEVMADIERLPVLENRPDAAEAASREQEIQILREAIADLPSRCREVFVLRKIHELSFQEIARKLGLSTNTVSNQLKIGQERCRRFLAVRGVKGVGQS